MALGKAFYLAQPQFPYLKTGKMSPDLLTSQSSWEDGIEGEAGPGRSPGLGPGDLGFRSM